MAKTEIKPKCWVADFLATNFIVVAIFPFQLCFLSASRPIVTGQVLGIVYRVISMHLIKNAG